MIPEFPVFKKLEITDRKEVESFTGQYPPYSDFNFINIWMWDIDGKMELSQLNGNLVLKFLDYITGDLFVSFLGDKKTNETARALLQFSKALGLKEELRLIPEFSAGTLDTGLFDIKEDPDNFDYIYSTKEQSEYAGGRFIKKRNQINRFLKYCTGRVIIVKELDLTDKNTLDDVAKLSKTWFEDKLGKGKECDPERENIALERYLSGNFSHHATGIYADSQLIAISICEILNNRHAVSHFGKADHRFEGIKAFLMNKNSAMLLDKGAHYLNYEQDLGLEGLRKAKTLFRPAAFLKKYVIHFSNSTKIVLERTLV